MKGSQKIREVCQLKFIIRVSKTALSPRNVQGGACKMELTFQVSVVKWNKGAIRGDRNTDYEP